MDTRQQYWDNYIKYWFERVADSNTKKSQTKDKMPNDEIMSRYITLLVDTLRTFKKPKKLRILDYGCGFGRAYPYFEKLHCAYYGVDIAQSCVDYASATYPKATIQKLGKNDVIPFEDDYFDGVFCYGVFDACYQHITIGEILRVLNKQGIALITGKNDNYLESDEMALVAEVGARKNNHPNFFTNTPLLIEQLTKRHINIIEARYFLKREDNATDTYLTTMPEKFYTYAFLVQKTQESLLEPFANFSDIYSKTFKNQDKKL